MSEQATSGAVGSMKSREAHMKWCKQRAHDALKAGDAREAIASMCSDIQRHDETRMPGSMLGMLMMAAQMDVENPRAIKRWIDGFN